MMKFIPIVDKQWEDMVFPYLAFCYKMDFQGREWTGYKELEELGLDPAWLRSLDILSDPTPTGAYRFIAENVYNLVKIYAEYAIPFVIDDELWKADNKTIASELHRLVCDQVKKNKT